MIFPDLPKVLKRQRRLHGSRKYFLKASEVYAILRQQRGFALVPGEGLRSALRTQRAHPQFSFGKSYVSQPGNFHLPEFDQTIEYHDWYAARKAVSDYGCKIVERYSFSDVKAIAVFMPFVCPRCRSSENPLKRWRHNFPAFPEEFQLICLDCWQTLTNFVQKTPAELWEIEERISKLNKEISNAEKRRTERRKAAKQLGNPGAERDVRHAGSENVTDPGLQRFAC